MSIRARQTDRFSSCSFGFVQSSLQRGNTRAGVSTPALLLIIVLAAIAAVMCYQAFLKRFDSELRAAVVKQLRLQFPDAQVFVHRVRKESGGKIVAYDVRMATEINQQPYQVFGAEEVIISGQLDIADFLRQTLKVEQVELHGVQIDAWQLANGRWSVEAIKPLDDPNKPPPPRVVLNDAIVKVRQSTDRQSQEVVFHGLRATVESLAAEVGTTGGAGRPPLRIQAAAQSSGLLENMTIDCVFDPSRRSLVATGNFAGLQFSPKLLERLPETMSQKLAQLSGLECEASSNFFEIKWAPDIPTEFICQGRLESGRWQDRRLPYPIEEISSDFYCRNTLLQMRNMHAKSGGARLTFETDIMGLSLGSPMDIEAKVEDLELDKRLYQSLPPSVQQQWDRLQLAGRVSGSLKLTFDGQTWLPAARIQCQQVSMKPWLFPYPLNQINGEIHYESGALKADKLTGRAGGHVVEGSMGLSHVAAPQGTQWIGWLRCRSVGAVAIDEDLIASLTPAGKPQSGAEKFVRSLSPTGGIELVSAHFERPTVDNPKWQRSIEAHVYDARLHYEKFPYPVYNIRGRIVNRGDEWLLESFEGRNDSARILCSGSWQQIPAGLLPFKLEFVAHTVPIVEDLFLALPARAQQVWDELQPSGSIDQVMATIQRPFPDAEIDTQVTILEERETNGSGKSLRLYPRKLPYLLDDVSCEVTYHNGVVTIDHATAQNGATRLAITGRCQAVSESKLQADINWLPSTRLMVDSHLVRALPKPIQETMQKLDFYGPISLLGRSQTIFGNSDEDISSGWDFQLDIEDGRLSSGAHIGAMRGTVWMRGNAVGDKLNATGKVAMDAMRVLKTPVTNLKGPFVILDNKLYFGSAVQEALPNPESNGDNLLTASALAGTLKLSGYGRLDIGKFYVDANLENAHLSALLKDIGIQTQQPEATVNADLKFAGVPWNSQTYDGSGTIHLTDAKLYELPVMMRFLSVASVSGNDASAFQRADIGFRLDGDQIPLQISADGEVLRLRGEGLTNLRRDIDLQLYTYVGRRVPIGQIISPILPESRFSTFMMIEVSGTLDSPDMERRPFPQLEATFQQIFPEVAERRPIRDAIDQWRN